MNRKILCILLLFLLPAALFDAAGRKKNAKERICDEFDVYLLIGQSNMAGRGYLFPDDKRSLDGVFLLNDKGKIEPAKQPLNRYSSVRKKLSLQGMCLGGSFARDIHLATGRKVLLVVNARGGTSARQWLPGADPVIAESPSSDDMFQDGEAIPGLYEEAVRRARQAMKYGRLKGILFHQGESDSHEKYAPLWADKVAETARSLRSELKVGNIPFIVGETNYSFKRAETINPQIRDLMKIVPECDWASAEGCNVNKDKLHFSRQGITLLGHRYAEKILQMVYGFSAAAAVAACDPSGIKPYTEPEHAVPGLVTLCDFDRRSCDIGVANASFSVDINPVRDEVNPSALVGCITLNGGTWDCIACNTTCPLDYALGTAEIRLKVLPPRDGASLTIKLAPLNSATCESTMITLPTGPAGKWQELVFDLSEYKQYSNFYRKVYIMPDGGEKIPGTWYFDDVVVPDEDISALSLFKRADTHLLPDASKAWMCNSIANPQILYPSQTIDGKWWLLVRGGDGVRGHLGYYTQDPARFNPLGPWDYFEGNPVIPAGWQGIWDSKSVIDPCGFTDNGTFYYYYKGTDAQSKVHVMVGTSTDGKNFTKHDTPWKQECGVADVLKWNGRYYLYVARRIYVYDDPLSGDGAEEHEIIQKGGAPDNCDWYSINGGKIFRLQGVDKWFLAYQAGVTQGDFPQRFHLAISDDLINWTKVQNPQPLFTRGPRGSWDQGAIWAPSCFEYKDRIYMYYEGWGHVGAVENRDKLYFLPGHSEIGIANCSKKDFLEWCGLK